MRCVVVVGACFALVSAVAPAAATVAVAIDLTHQRMHVQGAGGTYDWPISSARSGFSTPGGSYAPTRLEVMHYSHKYHMSPMPHAIFFRGGYAIHGTYATGSLGRPASHGCVRLSPGNAARLYAMVRDEGARISIAGSPPQGPTRIAAAHRRSAAPPRGEEVDPGFGADVDQAPPHFAARRLRQAVAGPRAYYGYRYVGQMEGHRVYQAIPSEGGGATFGSPD